MEPGEFSDKIPHMKNEAFSRVLPNSKGAGGDATRTPIALEHYKSAFFFIEDCFYNDNRWQDCQDISKVIRHWSSDPKRKIGPFKTAVMEETCIKDLTLRLGMEYFIYWRNLLIV